MNIGYISILARNGRVVTIGLLVASTSDHLEVAHSMVQFGL